MDISAATWATVSKLFDEALELEASARTAWLERITATDPQLALVLRKLLAAHVRDAASDPLQNLPPLDPPASHTSDDRDVAIGSRVGPYRLKRVIGQGGMAEVWLAERADGAFERDVALKLPRISLLRRDLAERFEHERDILARLEHPHIARFYDAGVTAGGLPYLAMEYVDGRPLTGWCNERGLTLRRRLALFAQVLEAVQFAHANLVIHRDLKPSNVLVTADAQARLLDFGIAKLLADGGSTHETHLTRFAGRALTPDYASPEQIKGEPLTIASDIYSLGVVLYELLTGSLPYRIRVRSVAQLEEAIIHAEPTRPSRVLTAEAAPARGVSERRLARALRGDLDTIVLKALAKKPADRYATVAELAEDLQRFRRGLPVLARPASWGYRARKFIVRHRVPVAVAAMLGVALVSAAAVSLWQAQRAREQATRADAVKSFVLSFFEGADTDSGGSRQTTALDLLKQARERLEAAPIADDSIRVELLITVASGLMGLGETQSAEPVLEEATRLARARLGIRDPLTAKASAWYGWALLAAGETKLAAAHFDAAVKMSRSNGDMENLARALQGTAMMRATEGQYDTAIDLILQAIDAGERAPAIPPYDLINMNADAASLMRAAHRKGALEPARRALVLARQVYGKRPSVSLLYSQVIYASALGDAGEVSEALRQMLAALQQETALVGRDSMQVATAYGLLGDLQLKSGDAVAARESLREKLRIAVVQSAGKPTGAIAAARWSLADILTHAHRYEEAVSEWREAERTYSTLYGTTSDEARAARAGAALALTKIGRLTEAEAALDSVIEQPLHSTTEQAFAKSRLGMLRSAQGRHREAQILLGEAADFSVNTTDWFRAVSLAWFGHVLLVGGQTLESLAQLQQAQALLRHSQPNGSPDLADISIDLSRAQFALGQPDLAQMAAREALTFWERLDPRGRDRGVALLWLARALAAMGQMPQASDALHEARGALGATSLPDDGALLAQAQREITAPTTVRP
jgi:serine/threonine-protein kinase